MSIKTALRRSLWLTPACFLSGCMATESTQGTISTYGNSWLNVLLLTVIAGVLIAVGAGFVNEARKASRPRVKKKRKGTASPEWTPRLMGKAGLGGVALAGGLLLLLLGVPSCLFASIEVREDRVLIEDSLLWFASSPREYPFASINDLSVDESATMSRSGWRKKSYLNIHHADGTERIEMTPMWHAARPKLEENWRKFRGIPVPSGISGSPAIAGTGSLPLPKGDAAAGTQPPQAAPSVANGAGNTTVNRLGRYAPGLNVIAKSGANYVPATVLRVVALGRVTVRVDATGEVLEMPLDDARVGPSLVFPDANELPGTEVADSSPVTPGQKLLSFYGGNWYPVKVRQAIAKDNYVEIEWQDEPGIHRVPRSQLRFPPPGDVVAIIKHPFPDPGQAATPAAGTPDNANAPYAVGEKLEVFDLGTWFPCEFYKLLPDGRVRIRLPSASGVATQDVDANTVRRPQK